LPDNLGEVNALWFGDFGDILGDFVVVVDVDAVVGGDDGVCFESFSLSLSFSLSFWSLDGFFILTLGTAGFLGGEDGVVVEADGLVEVADVEVEDKPFFGSVFDLAEIGLAIFFFPGVDERFLLSSCLSSWSVFVVSTCTAVVGEEEDDGFVSVGVVDLGSLGISVGLDSGGNDSDII